MDINYLILAHQNPAHLGRLIQKLQTDNTYFYVYIDKKSDLKPFETELAVFDNIYMLKEERIEVKLGTYKYSRDDIKSNKKNNTR